MSRKPVDIPKMIRDEMRSLRREIGRAEGIRVSPREAEQLAHCVGMIADLGDGELARGIEMIRDNHKWIYAQRKRTEKISLAFLTTCVSVGVAVVAYSIWEGIKAFLVPEAAQ